MGYFETSAKDSLNVDKVFNSLAKTIIEKDENFVNHGIKISTIREENVAKKTPIVVKFSDLLNLKLFSILNCNFFLKNLIEIRNNTHFSFPKSYAL